MVFCGVCGVCGVWGSCVDGFDGSCFDGSCFDGSCFDGFEVAFDVDLVVIVLY